MTGKTKIYALIVAAGVGARAGGAVPKQYALVGGKPLLCYCVEALASHPRIAAVMVVIHPEHADLYAEAVELGAPLPAGEVGLLSSPKVSFSNPGEGASQQADSRPHPDLQPHHISPRAVPIISDGARDVVGANPTSPDGRGAQASPFSLKLLPPLMGGAERADSVRAGLAALAAHAPDYVLIHDAARPFLSHAMIDRILEALTLDVGVVPALAVADTVRRLDGNMWSDVSRDGLMRIQTPQAFPFAPLLTTHHSPLTSSLTDDAAIWLAAGHKLAYVAGDEELRKVTTAEDIAWANARAAGARRVAVGSGYDVHALVPGEGVIRLGGVDIAHDKKLDGHSDADVVLHAVVDALLGSISAGDIGSFFPPSDARWKGANSAIFIEEARAQVAARGGVIQHLDITLIGEQPKISPHRDAMRVAIARMLKLPLSHISVKATTTEKLGFTGREEGIACHATATVSLPMEMAA